MIVAGEFSASYGGEVDVARRSRRAPAAVTAASICAWISATFAAESGDKGSGCTERPGQAGPLCSDIVDLQVAERGPNACVVTVGGALMR